MPALQFKGKNIIWSHHLSIPCHTLEEVSKLNFQADKSAVIDLNPVAWSIVKTEVAPVGPTDRRQPLYFTRERR